MEAKPKKSPGRPKVQKPAVQAAVVEKPKAKPVVKRTPRRKEEARIATE